MSVRSLRRGMRVMTICGDADEPDFDRIAAPTLVTRVDRSDEDYTGIELCNERTQSALGMGTFENQAVAWIANADDLLLLNGSPTSPDVEEPLGAATSSSDPPPCAPVDWPRFPGKQSLPSQDDKDA